MSSTFSGDETAPFFGFLGAAAALVFSCTPASPPLPPPPQSRDRAVLCSICRFVIAL
jgi:hypothetical protein